MTSLLSDFVSFHASRPHGSLGYVEMNVEPVPDAWVESFARLADDAVVFGTLPDGSLLVLARTSEGEKVILLGSEGETDTLGESVADFLWRWSRGDTGEAYDLNEGSVAEIATWLRERGIAEPSSPKVAFDANAWHEGGSVDVAPVVDVSDSDAVPEALEPLLREVANAVGRRADDARVVELVGKLGKRVPASLSDSKWVEAPKQGLQLLFEPELLHADHAPVPKTKSSFVPFLSLVDFGAKASPTVLGVTLDAPVEALDEALGVHRAVPTTRRDDAKTTPEWRLALGRDVELVARGVEKRRWSIAIRQALSLGTLDVSTRVFLGWAATRGLLEPLEGLAALATRETTPSTTSALYPRGLWDVHLREPLRHFAYGWFHRIGPVWIRSDFESVFGSRPGPHGHAMPDLDDDGWASVDRVTSVLEERFAAFV